MSFTSYISNTVNSEYFFIKEILEKIKQLQEVHVIASIAHTEEGINDILNNINKNKKNILIQVSEETETPYTSDIYDYFYMVFRTYNNNCKFDNKKVFPIPCGCMTRLLPNIKTEIQIPTIKKVLNRKYDILFTGHGHASSERQLCTSSLQKLTTNKKLINLTNGFAQGYPLQTYYNLLNDTKISAVPKGVSINESFRFFESFRMGCIVITTLPILKNSHNNIWYYQNCPAITIDNWNELNDDIINSILNKTEEYFYKSIEYYKMYLSANAVAAYILTKALE